MSKTTEYKNSPYCCCFFRFFFSLIYPFQQNIYSKIYIMIRDAYKLPDEPTFRVILIDVGAEAGNNNIQFISYLEEGECFFEE